jgi:hypothetical protein
MVSIFGLYESARILIFESWAYAIESKRTHDVTTIHTGCDKDCGLGGEQNLLTRPLG